MGAGPSKVVSTEWAREGASVSPARITRGIDGSLPTDGYQKFNLFKKTFLTKTDFGVCRIFDADDDSYIMELVSNGEGGNNQHIVYTTRALEGSPRSDDFEVCKVIVIDPKNGHTITQPVLRIEMTQEHHISARNIATRPFWTVYRYNQPCFPGQQPAGMVPLPHNDIDANYTNNATTSYYKVACITLAYSRQAAIAARFTEPSPEYLTKLEKQVASRIKDKMTIRSETSTSTTTEGSGESEAKPKSTLHDNDDSASSSPERWNYEQAMQGIIDLRDTPSSSETLPPALIHIQEIQDTPIKQCQTVVVSKDQARRLYQWDQAEYDYEMAMYNENDHLNFDKEYDEDTKHQENPMILAICQQERPGAKRAAAIMVHSDRSSVSFPPLSPRPVTCQGEFEAALADMVVQRRKLEESSAVAASATGASPGAVMKSVWTNMSSTLASLSPTNVSSGSRRLSSQLAGMIALIPAMVPSDEISTISSRVSNDRSHCGVSQHEKENDSFSPAKSEKRPPFIATTAATTTVHVSVGSLRQTPTLDITKRLTNSVGSERERPVFSITTITSKQEELGLPMAPFSPKPLRPVQSQHDFEAALADLVATKKKIDQQQQQEDIGTAVWNNVSSTLAILSPVMGIKQSVLSRTTVQVSAKQDKREPRPRISFDRRDDNDAIRAVEEAAESDETTRTIMKQQGQNESKIESSGHPVPVASDSLRSESPRAVNSQEDFEASLAALVAKKGGHAAAMTSGSLSPVAPSAMIKSMWNTLAALSPNKGLNPALTVVSCTTSAEAAAIKTDSNKQKEGPITVRGGTMAAILAAVPGVPLMDDDVDKDDPSDDDECIDNCNSSCRTSVSNADDEGDKNSSDSHRSSLRGLQNSDNGNHQGTQEASMQLMPEEQELSKHGEQRCMENEEPLIGYWSWKNSLTVHKMELHLVDGSDLALHVVLAIVMNQIR